MLVTKEYRLRSGDGQGGGTNPFVTGGLPRATGAHHPVSGRSSSAGARRPSSASMNSLAGRKWRGPRASTQTGPK